MPSESPVAEESDGTQVAPQAPTPAAEPVAPAEDAGEEPSAVEEPIALEPFALAGTSNIVVEARVLRNEWASGTDLDNAAHLEGLTYRLHAIVGAGTTANPWRPGDAVGEEWAECTVPAASTSCTITVPDTDVAQAQGGNRDRQFFVVQVPNDDTYSLDAFRLGHPDGPSAGSVGLGYYAGRTGSQLRSGEDYTFPGTWAADRTDWHARSSVLAAPLDNPELEAVCSRGLRVAIQVDLSSSVSASQRSQYRSALSDLFTSLQGTGTEIGLFTFARYSPADDVGGAWESPAPRNVDTSLAALNADVTRYTQTQARESATNWDNGLRRVATANVVYDYDVVLFLTDGAPNVIGANDDVQVPGQPNYGYYVVTKNLEQAVFSANAIKDAGTRVAAVGIGNGAEADVSYNLAAVSGPTADSDYYQTPWAGLSSQLQEILQAEACEAPVTATKYVVDADGGNAVPTNDWQIGLVVGTVSAGTATVSGSSPQATGSGTNAAGQASWTVSFTDPDATATLTLTETAQTGYVFHSGSYTIVHADGTETTGTFTSEAAEIPGVVYTDRVEVAFRNTGTGLTCEAGSVYALAHSNASNGGYPRVYQIDLDSGAATSVSNQLLYSTTGRANSLAISENGLKSYYVPQASGSYSELYEYDHVTGSNTLLATFRHPSGAGTLSAVRGGINSSDGIFWMSASTGTDSTVHHFWAYDTLTGVNYGYVGRLNNAQLPDGTTIGGGNGDLVFDQLGNMLLVTSTGSQASLFRLEGFDATLAEGGSTATTPPARNVNALVTGARLMQISTGGYNGITFDNRGYLYLSYTSGTTSYLVTVDPNTGANLGQRAVTGLGGLSLPGNQSRIVVDLADCNDPGALRLQKDFTERVDAGDQVTLRITPAAGANTATTTGTAPGVQDAVAGPIIGVPGRTYTLWEELTAASTSQLSDYDTTLECRDLAHDDALVPVVRVADGQWTMAFPDFEPWDGYRLGNVVCTYTNAPAEGEYTVSKTSDPPTGSLVQPGDSIAYTVQVAATGGPVTQITLTDDLADVLDDATWGPAEPTLTIGDSGPVVVPSPVDGQTSWEVGPFDLADGQTATLAYQVTVDADAWSREVGNVVTGTTDDGTSPTSCDPCSTGHETPGRFYVEKIGQSTDDEWVRFTGSQWQVLSDDEGVPGAEASGVAIVETAPGLFQVTGVGEGSFWLVETVAPEGFQLLAEPVSFTVASDGTVVLGAGGEVVSLSTESVDGVTFQLVSVRDVPAFDLPEAGGAGLTPFYVVGGLLVLAAVGIAVVRRRGTP